MAAHHRRNRLQIIGYAFVSLILAGGNIDRAQDPTRAGAARDELLVFYDHSGTASLDAAAYFAGPMRSALIAMSSISQPGAPVESSAPTRKRRCPRSSTS